MINTQNNAKTGFCLMEKDIVKSETLKVISFADIRLGGI